MHHRRPFIPLLALALLLAAAPWPGGGQPAASQPSNVVRLMRTTDPLRGGAEGSWDRAYGFATHYGGQRPADIQSYFQEIYRLAVHPQVGLDPDVIVAQSALETDTWRSPYWVNNLNPAAIGVTYYGQTSSTWTNGTNAARGHLVHLYLYAVGQIPAGHVLEPYKYLDPRYQAAINAGYAGIARTIDDLTGRWATDPQYAPKIVGRGNNIWVRLRLVGAGRSANSSTAWAADDASSATSWASTTTTPTSAFVWFDLGAFKAIGPIRWMFGASGNADAMQVQTSNDRVSWTTIVSTGNAPAFAWQELLYPTAGRYVRFYFTNPNRDAKLGSLAEVEVWPPTDAPIGGSPPPPPAATATATALPTATPTRTPVPPTATNTPVPATATATPTRTPTPLPASATPTFTPVPATATPTFTPVPATATFTPVPPTPTFTPVPVPPTATPTPVPAAVPFRVVGSGRTANSTTSVAVYDKNPGTYWATNTATPPATAYVYVDIGAVQPIGSVRWLFALDGAADAMQIQVSTDRVNWATIAQASNAPVGAWQVLPTPGITARYVRFYLTNPNGDSTLGGIAEIEVWP